MKEPDEQYSMVIEWSEQDQAYIVSVPELPGCQSHGPTYEEAAQQGHDAIASWLSARKMSGRPIPPPRVLAQP